MGPRRKCAGVLFHFSDFDRLATSRLRALSAQWLIRQDLRTPRGLVASDLQPTEDPVSRVRWNEPQCQHDAAWRKGQKTAVASSCLTLVHDELYSFGLRVGLAEIPYKDIFAFTFETRAPPKIQARLVLRRGLINGFQFFCPQLASAFGNLVDNYFFYAPADDAAA